MNATDPRAVDPTRADSAVAFARSSTSTPAGASALRTAFRDWITRRLASTAEQLSDLTLAVNEALANAVEHAYAGDAAPGTVEVHAQYERRTATLVVTVRDHGSWRNPSPDPLHLRGRGIPLIRALTTDASIQSDETGTCVELRWQGVSAHSEGDGRPESNGHPIA
jgi:anti-sigma regulatory factor (Ser/Thr protein kinase)